MTRIPVTPELLTRARTCVALKTLTLTRNVPKLITGELRIPDADQFLENLP